MTSVKSHLMALALAFAAAMPGRAEPASSHQLILCAQLTNNFVVGSKLTTASGLFLREGEGNYRHFGLNFPFIFNVAVDPRDSQVLHVASLNGALVSRDGGRTWRIGTSWDMTEPKDIFVDPNDPDTVYLALPDGIAVSRDAGKTWPRAENGLPARGKYTQVVKVDRTKAGRALAGCESGLYITNDAAKSWRRVFETKTTITDLRQSPHDEKLWLATTQSNGVLVSRDGGVSWKKFEGVPSAEALYNVAFDGTNPQRFAVASWSYGIYVTEDGGKNWEPRNTGLPAGNTVFRVGIDPDTGRMYAAVFRDAIFRSDDFGLTWTKEGLDGSLVYNFVFLPKTAN